MRNKLMIAAIAALAIGAATLPVVTKASPPPVIPDIPASELIKAHVVQGCNLRGATPNVQRIFGSYALAVSGSGHIPQGFWPNGDPATADVGGVWCRFNRAMSYQSDFMLVRFQTYTSSYVARKGFNLAVNMQNAATPNNRYTVSKQGPLTLAVRKYGEIIAVSGDALASAAWYVPAQQQSESDMMNRKVGGSRFIPMMFAMLCPNGASSC